MLPYSRGILLDNTNNYGIVKTETLIGFGPSNHDNFSGINSSEPLEWILTHNNFTPRSLQVAEQTGPREFEVRVTTPKPTPKKSKNKRLKKKVITPKKQLKPKSKRKGKIKKCIVKFLNQGENKKHKRKRFHKMQKKYMVPLLLGLLAAKSLLIPIALKALAFLSIKGLILGFFSTVMASVLSLKGMLDHSHGYQNRKDDTKTQVEIIQVPSKTEDHYYDDHHYRREDLVPVYVEKDTFHTQSVSPTVS